MAPPRYFPLFFNCDTTGNKETTDRIVRINFFDAVTPHFQSWLVNPGCDIPENVRDIHGITNAHVARSPPLAQVWPLVETFVSERVPAGEVPLLIAHNNDKFFRPLLVAESERHGFSLPADWAFGDSLPWFRGKKPELKAWGLENIRQKAKVYLKSKPMCLYQCMRWALGGSRYDPSDPTSLDKWQKEFHCMRQVFF